MSFAPYPKQYTVRKPKQGIKKVSQKKIQKALDADTVPVLVEQLDDVYSLFIRLSNADEKGICKCITCNKPHHYTKIQCGHFLSRKHYAIRWEPRNTDCQCLSCNIFNQGEQVKFGRALQKKYGEGVIDELLIRKNNKFKLEKFVLKLLIAEYTLKISELRIKLEL